MITPFGSGVMFGKQRSSGGVQTANPTPHRFAIMQDAQVDIKADDKDLYGQNQMPVRSARGKLTVTVKSKIASVDPNMLNDLFLGCPSSVGITLIADSEQQIVGQAAPAARANSANYAVGDLYSSGGFVYKCVTAGESAAVAPALETIIGSENADGTAVFECLCPVANSIAVANIANFVGDFGVLDADGAPMVCSGAVAPIKGQYQVNNGAYVFSADDAGMAVSISYTYKVPNRGTTLKLSNQPQGKAPEFEAFLYNIDENAKFLGLSLIKCRGTDMSIPTKQGDYWISSFDFKALADDVTGDWGALYADNY